MRSRNLVLMQSAALPALCAIAGVVCAATAPMGYDDARHLLARTGFGPTDAEVRSYAALPRDDAVARLLSQTRTTTVTPPPPFPLEPSPLRAPLRPAPDAPDHDPK